MVEWTWNNMSLEKDVSLQILSLTCGIKLIVLLAIKYQAEKPKN